MAEFTEVIKQAQRMHYAHASDNDRCPDCPLDCEDGACMLDLNRSFDLREVESRIMDWAKEHPAPMYPTWKEWQDSMFPNADARIRPCLFVPKNPVECIYMKCSECVNRPIPAEIAEKLGIKPKEI